MTTFEREEELLWMRLERAGANLLAEGQSAETVERWMESEYQREYAQLLPMRRAFALIDQFRQRRDKQQGLAEKGLKLPKFLHDGEGSGGAGSRRGSGRGRGGEI
jgi:hypothetical protein